MKATPFLDAPSPLLNRACPPSSVLSSCVVRLCQIVPGSRTAADPILQQARAVKTMETAVLPCLSLQGAEPASGSESLGHRHGCVGISSVIGQNQFNFSTASN